MTQRTIKVFEDIVVSALRELADEVYQRRVWVIGSPGEVSSMEEATAALYSDSGVDVAFEKNMLVFGPEIDDELKRLKARLRKAIAGQGHLKIEDILRSTAWAAIRAKSNELLDAIALRRTI